MYYLTMILFNLVYLFTWLASGTCTDVRVIGGSPVRIEEAPFMALFRSRDKPVGCGASILNKRFLVSAAHCSRDTPLEIIVGTDQALSGGERFDIEKTFVHPDYKKSAFDNDIMVIKLSRDLEFSNRVQPIELAEPGLQIPDDAQLQILGFGKTEKRPWSDQLLGAVLSHVPLPECKASSGFITDNMICAGQKGRTGCFSDSGGPLVYNNKLVGVVSFGSANCDNYTVFARISSYRDFIDNIIANN